MLIIPLKAKTAAQEIYPLLNEFLANPEGADTDLEWIELFYAGEGNFELTGWEIRVDDKVILTFDNQQILAGEYKLLGLPGSKLPNCSSRPCSIRLSLWNGEQEVDSVDYDHTTSSVSWSRTAKGNWTEEYQNSPGAENLPPPPIIKTLLISEIYPSPNSGEEEWIEIFNWGTGDIDLTNWQISDLSSKSNLPGEVISPGQYLLLSDLSITLNNTGDTISLIAPDGEVANELVYGSTKKGEAVARFGTSWELLDSTNRPTPQAANLPRYNEPKPTPTPKRTSPQDSPPPAESLPAATPTLPKYKLPNTKIAVLPQVNSAGRLTKLNLSGLWLALGIISFLAARQEKYWQRLACWWQAD